MRSEDLVYSAIELRARQYIEGEKEMERWNEIREKWIGTWPKQRVLEGEVMPDETQKPMVTREQYDRARAVLDALPAGYYVKCGGCGGWFSGGKFKTEAGRAPVCERCW